jgi:hypothetical protein
MDKVQKLSNSESTKLLKHADVKFHEYLLSHSGVPSCWRTHMVNLIAALLQLFFAKTRYTFALVIESPASDYGLEVLIPQEHHMAPHVTRCTSRPLVRRVNSVAERLCLPPSQRIIRLGQIVVFSIRILTLICNRSIETDKRRLSNLMPQCYQHSLRIWSLVERIIDLVQ